MRKTIGDEFIACDVTAKFVHKSRLMAKSEKELLQLGLYEKVYAPDDTKDYKEYPCSEYDNSTGGYRNYKKVVVEVTDEEYRENLEYSGKSSTQGDHGATATALSVIAWTCMIVAAITGLIQEDEFSILIALPYWVGGLISGIVFLGFSKVIKLLEDIKSEICGIDSVI